MKIVEAYHVYTQGEAEMYKELLRQNGINAQAVLRADQQALRLYGGGSANPFDVWLIAVPEDQLAEAKNILPEALAESPRKNLPRTGYKLFASFWIIIIAVLLSVGFYSMFKYIFQ